MKKIVVLFIVLLFVLSACSGLVNQTTLTETPFETVTKTPKPPTATVTVTPTATATPLPIPINADNFGKIVQTTSTAIDQSKFVGFDPRKNDFAFEGPDMPHGDVLDAHFISYQLINGDLVGLLQRIPYFCGDYSMLGEVYDTSCSYYNKYISMINLSQNTNLWTQAQPMTPAGPELKKLLKEFDITDFVPRMNLYKNGGKHLYKWSQDNQLISVPVREIDYLLVKDVLSGENIYQLPMGNNRATWIGALSPDEKKIAYIKGGINGGMDTINIYNIESQSVEFKFDIAHTPSDIEWSNDSSLVAVGNSQGVIMIINTSLKEAKYLVGMRFDLAVSAKQVEYPFYYYGIRGITRLKFSHDNKKIAFTEYNYKSTGEKFSRVVLYDLETRQEINSYDADFLQNGFIEWSDDDTFIVTVSDFTDGRILLLDDNHIIEIPLEDVDDAEDYDPEIFTSQIYFSEDQTQLILIRSLFTEAVISVYEAPQ